MNHGNTLFTTKLDFPVFAIGESRSNDAEWILDSGAGSNCTNNGLLLSDLSPTKKDLDLIAANGHKMKVYGQGGRAEVGELSIYDVLHVSNLGNKYCLGLEAG